MYHILEHGSWLVVFLSWHLSCAFNRLFCCPVSLSASGYFYTLNRPSGKKNLPSKQETCIRSLGWEGNSNILAWKSHEQRNLAGHSPWGCKESDTMEQLSIGQEKLSAFH